MDPKITVMVTIYNSITYLRPCLDSLKQQTFKDFEVLMIDDGSTDDSPKVYQQYIERDPRFRVIRFEQNRGIGFCRLTGLQETKGEYVAILDSDDIACSTRLEKQFSYLENHKDVVLVSSFYNVIDINGILKKTRRIPLADLEIRWRITFGNCLAHSTVMYRTKEAIACGGYDPATPCGEDAEFYSKIISLGRIGVIPEVLAHWRSHPSNWTKKSKEIVDYHRIVGQSILRHLNMRVSKEAVAAVFNNNSTSAKNLDVFREALSITLSAFQIYEKKFSNDKELLVDEWLIARCAFVQLIRLKARNRKEEWWNEAARSWSQVMRQFLKKLSHYKWFKDTKLFRSEIQIKTRDLFYLSPIYFFKNKYFLKTPEDPEQIQRFALQNFRLARESFSEEKFSNAENLMKSYRKYVNYDLFTKTDNRKIEQPLISVIIVAYQTNQLLLDCLNSLSLQTDDKFEIIVVDNGGNESVEEKLKESSILYIKCSGNMILSEGRNIGVHFAKGEIIAFLDDDATVPNNYVESIRGAFEIYDIIGLRGRVLPKTGDKNNSLIHHYDLGNTVVPSDVNVEGNSAFRKEVYEKMGGMEPLLFGHEGYELSYRISKKYGKYALIYWPETVIFHDFDDDKKVKTKNIRHALMKRYVVKKFHGIKKYRREMKGFLKDNNSRKEGNALIKRKLT